MKFNRVFPLGLLILIEIPHQAWSYKCYQCLSESNVSCTTQKPIQEFQKYLMPCEVTTDTNEPCCRTMWKTVHFTLRKKGSLVRECCGPNQKPVGGCYRTEYATLAYKFNCECHYEGCNGAITPSALQLQQLLCPLLIVALHLH